MEKQFPSLNAEASRYEKPKGVTLKYGTAGFSNESFVDGVHGVSDGFAGDDTKQTSKQCSNRYMYDADCIILSKIMELKLQIRMVVCCI